MHGSWDDNGTYSVRLDGNWTACTAAGRLQELAAQALWISERVMHFIGSNPEGRIVTEIDLNGVTALDDNGCNILVMWMRHLQKHRFYPVVIHEDAAVVTRFQIQRDLMGESN